MTDLFSTASTSRRTLLAAAGAAAVTAVAARPAAAQAAQEESPAMSPEFYELRAYHLRRGPMSTRLDTYLKDALMPAAKRAGCGPVGVFNVTIGMGNPTAYVLICHPTLASFAELPGKLNADADYAKAAEPFLASPATDPAYASLDVRLMRAFPHFPKLQKPPGAQRIVELRTYRSHGDPAGAKKVEMFDTAGEIEIFRWVGLTPVFFARDLTGQGLPSLTYLLTFPDLATREKNWNTFRNDPEWKKLSTTPGFTDAEIVTGIDNQILTPAAYSEI